MLRRREVVECDGVSIIEVGALSAGVIIPLH